MKKKLMMVAVLLGALSLGACVDDNESQSVTNLRDAKAQQLTALAEKARAEGEAAKIVAEAEAALKEAQAAYKNNETEIAKQRFAVELEEIKAKAEQAIAEAKLYAQKAEQQLLEDANQHLANLYLKYSTEVESLNQAKQDKADYEIEKARLEAGLGTVQEYITTLTERKNAEIKEKEAEKAAWENYSGLDKSELEKELNQLNQQKYAAFAEWNKATEDATSKKEASDAVLEVYSTDYEGVSTVAAVAAIQKYNESSAMSTIYFNSDPSDYWYQIFQNSLSNGYIDWGNVEWDDNMNMNKVTAMIVWDSQTNQNILVAPISSEEVSLTDEITYNVEKYSLRNEAVTTYVNHYYANGKDNVENWLGSPASDSKLATGLYLTLDNQKTALENAQTALTKAEEEFATLEKGYKTATDNVTSAEAAEKTAKTSYDNAVKATGAAQAALDEANKGTDAAAITAAQNALNAAKTAEANALTAYNNAIANVSKAQTALTDAESKYNTSRYNTLPNAKEDAQKAEMAVAEINDQIASATKQIENWDENAALWTAMVTALQSEDYTKAIDGLKNNADVAAYITAELTAAEKEEAYNEINTQVGVLTDLINDPTVNEGNIFDPKAQIEACEDRIAELKNEIATITSVVQSGMADSQEGYEELISICEVNIANLEDEIAIKEKLVETYKAAVESAINNGETVDTPAEGGEVAA